MMGVPVGKSGLGLTTRRRAKRLPQLYAAATEYFIPPALRRDREQGNRARMFLLSHVFGPILGLSAPLSLYLLDPTPGYEIAVLALSILGFWLFPFLMRAGVPYPRLVQLSVMNLYFAILWSCFAYGGITSPTVIWVLIIPILCVFYMGGAREMYGQLLLISLVSFALFFLSYSFLPVPVNDMPHAANLGLSAVSMVATLCYVGMMAIYYARIFHAGVDLENEVQRRRQLAVELRKAVVAANRASASKSEFLARMSHELRTPLNAIIGYAQLLREEAQDTGNDPLEADIDRILDAGEYLVRLINLILDLSKIEAGRMELNLKRTDVGEIVTQAAEQGRGMIEAGGNELRLRLSTPPDARVDRTLFRKVVDAILENAAQHTAAGVVTVTSGVLRRDGREFFTVSVEDTGEGIAADQLPSIMESFATDRSASRGRYGGTGLSLTVASKLCQVMGGWIDVDSRIGRGSRFTMVLPVEGLRAGARTSEPVSAAA